MYVAKTNSTNSALAALLKEKELPDGFTLYTYYQTAGRGQVGNKWESEKGQNLLMSTLIRPKDLPISEHFILSEIVALALKDVLDRYTDDIRIKWPNDIYWKDKKISGTLIENSFSGSTIRSCIAGIGLNLNQTVFVSDAPNPISLKQITGQEYDKRKVLEEIMERLAYYKQQLMDGHEQDIRNLYAQHLYRKEGWHEWVADGKSFQARIKEVKADGQLVLEEVKKTKAPRWPTEKTSPENSQRIL